MHDISGLRANAAIELTGINLSLGRGATRVHILKDVNLHIGSGEAVGLVGPSGSGKSSLLMIMAGLERPDTGAVRVAGEDLRRARRGCAGALSRPPCGHRVPVVPSHPDHDGARERRHPARARGRQGCGGARRRRARGRRPGGSPRTLSGRAVGRRAAAGRARPRPRPQSGDPARRRADRQSRRDDRRRDRRSPVREPGRARHHLVLVTHDPALARRCDRVVRMRSGRIDGAPGRETSGAAAP